MNKAYAYGKSVRITAESLGIAIPAFGTITVMFCVTSEISVIIIVYITSGLGDGDKNLSCQRHTWGACHYSLPSYLLCPRAFKLWGALPEGVMLIIKSNLSSRIVSTNTSAQLFIAALGTSAFSRIRNPFLVCPCEDQSPPPATNGLPACLPGCLAVCIGVIETCLLHPVSLICLNVQWPIITAMSRRRKQPIISGLAGLVEPIRSRIPMVTCAWKPGHSQSEQSVPLSY